MAKAKYCICCGKKGIRWPKYRPVVCAMRCAAWRWMADDRPALYCSLCGGFSERCGCEEEGGE